MVLGSTCAHISLTVLSHPAFKTFAYHERSLVVEDDNIGVEPDAQITLALFKANLLCRVLAAPPHHLFDAEVGIPLGTLGPQDGQAETNAGDSSPGAEEVTLLFGTLLFVVGALAAAAV